jgi:hypothetical protein
MKITETRRIMSAGRDYNLKGGVRCSSVDQRTLYLYLCLILGFRREADDNWPVLGNCIASCGNSIQQGFMNFEDVIDSLFRNVGKNLPLLAAS